MPIANACPHAARNPGPAASHPQRLRPLAQTALAGAACLLSALAAPALAGRPLATDDADVLAAQDCEWETLAARLRHQQPALGLAWQTELGCGIGNRLQLSGGLASSPDQRERTQLAGLGAKLQLLDSADKAQLQLAATFGVNVLRVTDTGFTVRDNSLALVASQRLGSVWTTHLNLGWMRDRQARQTSTTWNLALERDLGDGIDAVGEIFGDDRGQPWLSGGLRWALSANTCVHAAFSVRRGGATTAQLATLGFKLAF